MVALLTLQSGCRSHHSNVVPPCFDVAVIQITNVLMHIFLRSHHAFLFCFCFDCNQPTRTDRGWLVMPFGKNPWWWYLASAVPALLVTILIFMDQQISAVIVNRKENKLKVSLCPKRKLKEIIIIKKSKIFI